MYIIPNIPHLRNLRLAVEYRELPEDESQLIGWKVPQKWKQDPDADRFYGFAPRSKYYLNGVIVDEEKPGLSATSNTPFPEKRVPRRGLQQVFPDDPDYVRLCVEQGLEHLLARRSQTPSLPNGIHSSPSAAQSNGIDTVVMPPQGVNGGHHTLSNTPAVEPIAGLLPNGVNGVPPTTVN
jgi:hypothetical protein